MEDLKFHRKRCKDLVFTYKDEDIAIMPSDGTFHNTNVPDTKMEVKKEKEEKK